MRPLPLAHVARSLAAVGLVELALATRGRSVLDDLGEVVIDHSPLPLIELGVQLMGTTDKPLLRLQSLAALVAGGTALGARVAPDHGRVSRRTTALGVAGVGALAAARVVLARQQPRVRAELARPSAAAVDCADDWASTPLVTPVEDFYVTDVTMRAPVVDADAWRLEVEAADGTRAVLDTDLLAGLDLQERQALLACVHNRPGWDRLGQQSWTGLPVPDLLAALGLPVPDAADASVDLVMEGADGLVMTLPWPEVVARRSWLVTGMGGRPLTASHGHPARVLTAGLPGQYGGPKWVTALRLRPAGSVTASWVARGWPRGPVVVPLMARIYPNGKADVNHFHAAGGLGFVIGSLLDAGLLHEDVDTVAGRGLQRYTQEPKLDGDGVMWHEGTRISGDNTVLRGADEPFSRDGGLKMLTGPIGKSVIKTSALASEHRAVTGPAKVFDDQADFLAAFEAGQLEGDFVAVLRYQGPKANGMPELHKLPPARGILQDRGYRVALITDGRMSGASGKVPAAIHLTPEAANGGSIAKILDGDMITLDSNTGTLDIGVPLGEFEARPVTGRVLTDDEWAGTGRDLFSGMRAMVGPADEGAMFVMR